MWSSDFSRSPRLPYPYLSRVSGNKIEKVEKIYDCVYLQEMSVEKIFFFFFFLEWCNLKKFRKLLLFLCEKWTIISLIILSFLDIWMYENSFVIVETIDSSNIFCELYFCIRFLEIFISDEKNGVHAILYYISLGERVESIGTEEGSRHCTLPSFHWFWTSWVCRWARGSWVYAGKYSPNLFHSMDPNLIQFISHLFVKLSKFVSKFDLDFQKCFFDRFFASIF